MSSLLTDGIIYLLLITGIGFGGITVIGLLLFPDIRSRMYTATRASLISISAMTVSAIMYALFKLVEGGGGQYNTLILHALVLIVIVVIANWMMYQTISERIITGNACQEESGQKNEKNSLKK